MKITARVQELRLADPWKIAGTAGGEVHQTVLIQLTDSEGLTGLGEAAPASVYGESAAPTLEFLSRLDVSRLSFSDVPGSLAALAEITEAPAAARCALNVALLDGAARRAGLPLYDFLSLSFREHHHVTSYSIGLDTPERLRKKVAAAAPFPILKLKVGDANDLQNLAALRSVAPTKPLRLDANEAWRTREEALRQLERFAAADPLIQFVEQPMPRDAGEADLRWLKARSPLPLFADEACHSPRDIPRCAEGFHGINVKLVKTGGITGAVETLAAARRAGLQTMIGCMIETSALISAAAHLAELADHLDLDGNLLITNDPYSGVTAVGGVLSFAQAEEKFGLRVSLRSR